MGLRLERTELSPGPNTQLCGLGGSCVQRWRGGSYWGLGRGSEGELGDEAGPSRDRELPDVAALGAGVLLSGYQLPLSQAQARWHRARGKRAGQGPRGPALARRQWPTNP